MMANKYQASSPFYSSEVRKTMGLVTITDIAHLAHVSNRKIAICTTYDTFPKPKMSSPSGKKRLWCIDKVKQFLGSTDLSLVAVPEPYTVFTNPFSNKMAVKFLVQKRTIKPLSNKCIARQFKQPMGKTLTDGDWS
jgi:hypothetical protein